MKARLSMLHKTEAEWRSLTTFIPEAGELVIYDPDTSYSYSRVKVGDGKLTVNELDFFVDSAAEATLEKHKYSEVIDAGLITDYLK